MSFALSYLSVAAWATGEWDDPPRAPDAAGLMQPGTAQSQPPPDRESVDAELMRRIASGEKQALAELYDRFSGPLYGTALRILRDDAEAQDVVHDTFVALWEKAATFDTERGSAFAWAITLVRHRAIDRSRMRRRRAELLAASTPEDLGLSDAPGGGADLSAERGDDAQRVRAAVANLPAEQKRALELAFFGGLTQEQIAQTLQEPLGTVKARIRRGLLKLRESLALRP
jgi:RNA polymerase sigma-70 factor, ECF subfamily